MKLVNPVLIMKKRVKVSERSGRKKGKQSSVCPFGFVKCIENEAVNIENSLTFTILYLICHPHSENMSYNLCKQSHMSVP